MNIEIIGKKENSLLGRVQIKFQITHSMEPTPSREKMRNLIAANLQASPSNVVINYAKPMFGVNKTIGYAKIYNSKEQALKIELKHYLKRNGLLEEKKQE
ncbi:MAG: hypothetical protein RXN92_00595 [Thermoplasmatales archaeon]